LCATAPADLGIAMSGMALFEETVLRPWLENKWLCWGVGPILAANVGFFVTCVLLELLAPSLGQSQFITYSKDKSRDKFLAATQSRVSFMTQLKFCFWTMLGPTALFNGVVSAFIGDYLFPFKAGGTVVPPVTIMLLQVFLLLLIGDFGLYWGHRIQHSVPFLWKHCHSLHHTLDTPSPVSTLYIDGFDAFLQAALPILVSSLVVRPHPVSYYVYIALRLCDNAVNHCGLEPHPIIDLFTLKFLPFRASVGHHDSHHKYSGYTGAAKNYAEYFWIWDYMFGTLSVSGQHKKE
jgi:sterol desaturase/sphingolipid hydroxylase (fatty acid hydroxylase superfamily)